MKRKFVTKKDLAAVEKARLVLAKIAKEFARLEKARAKCDADRGKDPGGARWKAATEALYSLYDEVEAAQIEMPKALHPESMKIGLVGPSRI